MTDKRLNFKNFIKKFNFILAITLSHKKTYISMSKFDIEGCCFFVIRKIEFFNTGKNRMPTIYNMTFFIDELSIYLTRVVANFVWCTIALFYLKYYCMPGFIFAGQEFRYPPPSTVCETIG